MEMPNQVNKKSAARTAYLPVYLLLARLNNFKFSYL
jgi:hypothetical protein